MCSGLAGAGSVMRAENLADLPAPGRGWRAIAVPRIVSEDVARLWVFIPTYDEAVNLEPLVRATAEQLERVAPGDWRVLVVDDASPDGTGELAERLAQAMPQLEVLHRPARRGSARPTWPVSHALAAGAELVIVMDADFSHDPGHLPAMIAAARQRPGPGLALRGRRRDRQLATASHVPEPVRLSVRANDSRRAGSRPHERLPLRPPAGARDGRALDPTIAGLRLQHRADLSGAARRVQGDRGPDLLPRPRGGPEQDVACRSPSTSNPDTAAASSSGPLLQKAPVTPCSTVSSVPPLRTAITGRPAACASTAAMPNSSTAATTSARQLCR